MAQPGLTVVVSPLIALMKDQVDAMQAGGIPATFLNSSLAQGESRARLRGLHNGEFRLLYLAPERLMLSGVLSDLQRWNVRLLAVDEAHCISEWGHDFRPEYRQLAELRKLFPETPMMALTATATGRVREDIVKLLNLREPALLCRQFQPPKPHLPRAGQKQTLRPGVGIRPGATEGKRHRLLPVAQIRRKRGAAADRGRREGPAVSRRV